MQSTGNKGFMGRQTCIKRSSRKAKLTWVSLKGYENEPLPNQPWHSDREELWMFAKSRYDLLKQTNQTRDVWAKYCITSWIHTHNTILLQINVYIQLGNN